MLKESQIRQILLSLTETDNGFKFNTVDRTIYLYMDEVAPYVIGYKHDVRGFRCQGLSDLGKSIVE